MSIAGGLMRMLAFDFRKTIFSGNSQRQANYVFTAKGVSRVPLTQRPDGTAGETNECC
jgi:hypothetical protein